VIDGGGYGGGNGNQSLAEIIQGNNGGFIGVSIQYRLGAFGFLASDEVNWFGVVNAGIRDQTFALQWVQSYIHLFGGNASHVTISGESAGGGAVMLQAMAYGGTLGTSLFENVSLHDEIQNSHAYFSGDCRFAIFAYAIWL
jgi:carboxylesterase type B